MMPKRKKQLLGIILSLCMVMSVFFNSMAVVFADGDVSESDAATSVPVLEEGDSTAVEGEETPDDDTTGPEDTDKSDDIVILYTNDVHTYIDGTISYDVIAGVKDYLQTQY